MMKRSTYDNVKIARKGYCKYCFEFKQRYRHHETICEYNNTVEIDIEFMNVFNRVFRKYIRTNNHANYIRSLNELYYDLDRKYYKINGIQMSYIKKSIENILYDLCPDINPCVDEIRNLRDQLSILESKFKEDSIRLGSEAIIVKVKYDEVKSEYDQLLSEINNKHKLYIMSSQKIKDKIKSIEDRMNCYES